MSRTPARSARTRAETVSPAKIITDAIIARLEQGVSPWRKTWNAGGPGITRPLRACGLPYKGINVIYLWAVAEARGYASPTWMTYRQASEFGGQVRKGERGTLAVFYKSYSASDTDAAGDETSSIRRVMRSYTVFNVDQIDGLPERFMVVPPPRAAFDETHRDEIDAFIAATKANIVYGGDTACYIPGLDIIKMPHATSFDDYASSGATAAHELSHWTAAPIRLNRDLDGRFGSDKYAAEELVAEISSALLGADLGLPATHLDNHASYIDHWLKILRSDERALLTAAAKAEEAAGYLLRITGRAGSETTETSDNSDAGDAEPLALAA